MSHITNDNSDIIGFEVLTMVQPRWQLSSSGIVNDSPNIQMSDMVNDNFDIYLSDIVNESPDI